MALDLLFQIELLLAVLIPAGGTATFIVRYFWKKSQCFEIMKTEIERLKRSQAEDRETHRELYEKINKMSTDLSYIRGQLEKTQ